MSQAEQAARQAGLALQKAYGDGEAAQVRQSARLAVAQPTTHAQALLAYARKALAGEEGAEEAATLRAAGGLQQADPTAQLLLGAAGLYPAAQLPQVLADHLVTEEASRALSPWGQAALLRIAIPPAQAASNTALAAPLQGDGAWPATWKMQPPAAKGLWQKLFGAKAETAPTVSPAERAQALAASGALDFAAGRERRALAQIAATLAQLAEPADRRAAAAEFDSVADCWTLALQLQGQAAGTSRATALAERLLQAQRSDGGWAVSQQSGGVPATLQAAPAQTHEFLFGHSAVEITGLVLQALAQAGKHSSQSPAIRRAMQFLVSAHQDEGCWFATAGVSHGGSLLATMLALTGLRAMGESDREVHMLRAGEWLRSTQNADGGWGPIPRSIEEEGYRAQPSQVVTTAWAVLGLLASGDAISSSVHRGAEFLVAQQQGDASPWPGLWADPFARLHGVADPLPYAWPPDAWCWPALALQAFANETKESSGQ